MSYSRGRLTLFVDVFDEKMQRAVVLPELTPLQLVANILQEFRELEYLGDDPTTYQLLQAETQVVLDEDETLGAQVADETTVVLAEKPFLLPSGTRPPTHPLYLREMRTGTAFRIPWQPAIIGRVSENSAWNDQVAVDLRAFPTGMRVSRQHLKLWEENDGYYIEVMQNNPVTVRRDGQDIAALAEHSRQAIYPGDVIRLDRSDISLKLIVREEESRR